MNQKSFILSRDNIALKQLCIIKGKPYYSLQAIVEHDENYSRACVKETISEMGLNSLVMKFGKLSIFIISVKFICSPSSLLLGNNIELFQFRTDLATLAARMERVWRAVVATW